MWCDIGYKQKGMGLLVLIIWALIAIFIFMIVMKLLPVYRENMAIKTTLEAMVSDPVLQNGTKGEIRKSFNKRAQIDDISAVNGGDLEIDKEGGQMVLGIAYSVKTPLFANISLYIDFNENSGK
jgi:uncharacterized protein DUF4845